MLSENWSQSDLKNINILQYEFKADLSELDRLSQELDRFGKTLGLSPKCLFEIHLAVEEHFTNVVSYGYTDKKEHWIKITFAHENKTVEICIEDEGVPFNPLDAKTPDVKCCLEERKPGGLGIHLTKHCVDGITYQRKGPKNTLKLKKYI